MKILFLDDDKERRQAFKRKIPGAKIVDTAQKCIDALRDAEEDVWNIVFLDHDLGGKIYQDSSEEECGMTVVRWIQENEPLIRNIIVHSHNGPAGVEMVNKLRDVGYKAQYLPFSTMIKNLEKLNA